MGLFDAIGGAMGAGAAGGSLLGPIGSIGGALISGVGSLIGGQQQNAQSEKNTALQYMFNSALQNQANTDNVNAASTAFNRSQQQLQETEQYNTTMANTAFQRQVADLKAAGLNPILGMGTSGAPSPIASAAPPASPTVGVSSVSAPTAQNVLGQAIASAQQGSKLFGALQEQQIQNDNLKKQGGLIAAQADRAETDAKNAQSIADATVGKLNADAGASSASAQASLAVAEKTRNEASVNSVVGGSGDLWDLRSYVPAARRLWNYVSPTSPSPSNPLGPNAGVSVSP